MKPVNTPKMQKLRGSRVFFTSSLPASLLLHLGVCSHFADSLSFLVSLINPSLLYNEAAVLKTVQAATRHSLHRACHCFTLTRVTSIRTVLTYTLQYLSNVIWMKLLPWWNNVASFPAFAPNPALQQNHVGSNNSQKKRKKKNGNQVLVVFFSQLQIWFEPNPT